MKTKQRHNFDLMISKYHSNDIQESNALFINKMLLESMGFTKHDKATCMGAENAEIGFEDADGNSISNFNLKNASLNKITYYPSGKINYNVSLERNQ